MKIPPEKFTALLNSLSIETIQPMKLASERVGDLPSGECEVKLEYRQAFADGDPIRDPAGKLVFRMKCELIASCEKTPFFTHETTCIIIASVKDETVFAQAWADLETRTLFLDLQIKKTMWPFFREHVHSAMSRLGMPPVVLPWIL
ncbi:MAG: hypothetical protein EWM51_06885 [Treponema sp.]|nr:MAG: hypothetical protein EWM51_06885 [Treponema sp.]